MVPIVAVTGPGVTVMEVTPAPAYPAVTVLLAFMVTVQVTVVADPQPVHPVNVSLPEVVGAVKVTTVPVA